MLASTSLDVLNTVRNETDTLLQKCVANSLDAVGFYQRGSDSAVDVVAGWHAKKPYGPAVFFYPYRPGEDRKPKQYVTYRNGTWNGLLATWNEAGQREFWGNYSNGQRDGFCCLFEEDRLTAVVECTRNNAEAIHLIEANRITKSLLEAAEISKNAVAGTVLEKIGQIEQHAKNDSHAFCERARKAVQSEVGKKNKQRIDSFNRRSANRAAKEEGLFNALKKAGGL